MKLELLIFIFILINRTKGFQVAEDWVEEAFPAYEPGFVGVTLEPSNFQREIINEGAPHTPTQPRIYGDTIRAQQVCPSMVGPLGDGYYYCGGKEYGYCDRRTGVCHCRQGYSGVDCMDCAPSHYLSGSLCYPRVLCPNDCSKRGECDYYSGTCICDDFRTGEDCSQVICQLYDELCQECTEHECVRCASGYTVTNSSTCSPCWEHDPRCVECNPDECLTCADPLLLSIRRSGRRLHDPPLPQEDLTRELSFEIPFGSQSIYAFKEAEPFRIIGDHGNDSLGNQTVGCDQGLVMDAAWDCHPVPLSHVVCGHEGTLSFGSPTYSIGEEESWIRITVKRTGGGVGEVKVQYTLEHVSTGPEDVTATTPYTTNQLLVFGEGVVKLSFLVSIHDDREKEGDEYFKLRLMQPQGGARLGSQHIAVVKIIDDDGPLTSPQFSFIRGLATATAGQVANFTLHAKTTSNVLLQTGSNLWWGELQTFSASLSNELDEVYPEDKRRLPINAYSVEFEDYLNGTYEVSWKADHQGDYAMRIFLLTPGGLLGKYYEDEFFTSKRMERVDRHVNFTWGTGRLTEYSSDHVTVLWEGFIRPEYSELYNISVLANDNVRLWVDGRLAIDAWDWGPGESSCLVDLEADALYSVQLEYREKRQQALIKLFWESTSTTKDIIPSSRLYVKRELGSSPFNVSVVSSSTHAFSSLVYGSGLHGTTAGETTSFTVIPKDVYGNLRNDAEEFVAANDLFTATAVLTDLDGQGQGVREIEATAVYYPATATWEFTYTPTVSGTYNLDVLYSEDRFGNGSHVFGSPFTVRVPPAKAFAPRCELNGDGLHHGVAGYLQNFTIVAHDVFDNFIWKGGDKFQLYVYSQNSTNVYVIGQILDVGNGSYVGSLVPEIADHYWLAVTLEGQHVWDSPYHMLVVYGDPTGYTSTVEGGIGWRNATANLQNSFVIQARDAFGNKVLDDDFEVKAFLDYPRNISATPASFGNGTVEISYVPEAAGENQLRVFLEGTEIVGSPFRVNVEEGPLNASMSTATGSYLRTSEAGVHASFEVQARDDTSNPLDTGNSTVFRVYLTGADDVEGWVTYEGNGLYTGHYIAEKTGNYDLNVVKSGSSVHIQDSPFSLFVTPTYVDASRSLLWGVGLEGGVSGVAESVSIQSVDRFGNNRTVGGDNFVLSIYQTAGLGNKTATDFKDGSYLVDYLPTESGDYTVNVTVYQPRGLWVHYYYMQEFYKSVGTDVDSNIDFDWGIEAPIDDLPTDFFSVQWNGFVKAPHSEEFTFYLLVDPNSRVWLKVEGLEIASSEAGGLRTTEYSGSFVFEAGAFYEIEVRYSHTNENASISLEWSSPSHAREVIPTTSIYRLLTVTDGVYPVVFEPAAVSPIHSTMVGDVLSGSIVGQRTFTVEARDEFRNLRWNGGETVSVYAVGPGPSSFTGTIEDHQNSSYTVTIHPTVSGYYTMTVIILASRPHVDYGYYAVESMISQYNVENSPLRVYFSDGETVASTSSAFGKGLVQAIAGVTAGFTIQARDVYGNQRTTSGDKFTVYIQYEDVDQRYDEGQKVLDTEYIVGGRYAVEYNMTTAGDHSLVILFNDTHIAGSPFPLHVTPNIAHAPNCYIYNWRHFQLDALSTFQIQTKDVYGNNLEHGGEEFVVIVYGENLVYGTVIDNGDGTYSGSYNLTEAGDYELLVQLAHRASPEVAGGRGLTMAGFNNQWLQGDPVVNRVDPYINFIYGNELLTNTAKDLVSIRWTGFLKAHHSEEYTFEVKSSMHVRLFIQDILILDSSSAVKSQSQLEESRLHAITIEAHKKSTESSLISLFWESPGTPKQIIPSFFLFPSAENISGVPKTIIVQEE